MKKIVDTLLILILLLLIAGAIIPSFLPPNIHIKTSHKYKNPISEVFAEFNNLENFGNWGILIDDEDDLANTNINYFAPYKGEGSSITWNNKKNKNIGNGEYRIISSKLNKHIKFQLLFVESGVISIEDIYFTSNKGVTNVSIDFKTEDFSYFNRIFGYLYANKLEKILNESLEKLAKKLKNDNVIQTLAPGETRYTNFQGVQLVAIKNETSTYPEDIYKAMHSSLNEISKYLKDSLHYVPSDIKHPIAYYTKFDTLNKVASFYSGYPIKLDIIPNVQNIKIISIPSGKAIFTPINSLFKDILKSRFTLDKYSKENGVRLKNYYWEEYMDDYPLSFDDDVKGKAYYLIID